MIFLESKCFQLILTTAIGMTGGQSGSGSGMMESAFSSLFVPSQDVSTSAWEQYKTESLPSEDLSQCLARCMLHQRQWWNGLHSGWVSLKLHLMCASDVRFPWIFQVQRNNFWIRLMRGGAHLVPCRGRFWGDSKRFSHSLWRSKVCFTPTGFKSWLHYIRVDIWKPILNIDFKIGFHERT